MSERDGERDGDSERHTLSERQRETHTLRETERHIVREKGNGEDRK